MKKAKISKVIFLVFLLLATSSVSSASFLEDEAGISAYSTVTAADIPSAATAYKTIEYQTSEYIVGSVDIPDYPESSDVHVYLHNSGEIIAYYLRDAHLCHMIDWRDYHSTKSINGTKLRTALEIVASAMSESLSEINYYDFRYPEAPNIKVIIDNSYSGTDTFRYQIPNTYQIHAAFWSHMAVDVGTSASSTFRLDGTIVNQFSTVDAYATNHGDLVPAQLTPDVYHEVSISASSGDSGYVAIVLLYTEPQ